MSTAFEKLAPFVRKYIYQNEWNELRDVQVDAINAVLESEDHVLITAGTASGKTEAAFFPALTSVAKNPPEDSFGIVYIGPLKALINDQFERIESLIKDEAGFPVYAWHGDRPASEKQKAMNHPQGVLQITPEAMEGLLINHPRELEHMFSDLRFIMIDEIHAFMGTDRGQQLQCQLARLDRITHHSIRRIGLSATINNPQMAGEWLAAGSPRKTTIVTSQSKGRKLSLLVHHTEIPPEAAETEEEELLQEQLKRIYTDTCRSKALIFTNSRHGAEEMTVGLRNLAGKSNMEDIYHIHHGKISAMIRGESELALKEATGPSVAIATKTLELGIDLGKLEKVIQIGAPDSCSAFVQRLGRTGRRNTPSTMGFFTTNQAEGANRLVDLPWELLICIAMIQLYLEERWVEPYLDKKYPYSLMLHQTISYLMGHEVTGPELATAMYALPPFSNVPKQDYLTLLRHMLETELIEKTEDGKLIPGLLGEKLASNYRFFAVFDDNEGFRVIFDQRHLGNVDDAGRVGDSLMLAGQYWIIQEVDYQKKVIDVKPGHSAKAGWMPKGFKDIHTHVMQKIRQILSEDNEYAYLSESARTELKKARANATEYIHGECCSIVDSNVVFLHPWLGSKETDTLEFILQYVLNEKLKVTRASKTGNGVAVGLWIVTEHNSRDFLNELRKNVLALSEDDLVPYAPLMPFDCYDRYVPPELIKKAYVYNHLDLAAVKEWAGAIEQTPDEVSLHQNAQEADE